MTDQTMTRLAGQCVLLQLPGNAAYAQARHVRYAAWETGLLMGCAVGWHSPG
jgi:hypothetical protein